MRSIYALAAVAALAAFATGASAGTFNETTGTIHVVVVDDSLEPPARVAQVNLVVANAYGGDIVHRATTGLDGTVDLPELPFGRYIVMSTSGEYRRRGWRNGELSAFDDSREYCESVSPVVGVTPEISHAAVEMPIGGCSGGAAAWFAAIGPQAGTAGYLGSLVGLPLIPLEPLPNTR